MIANFFLDNRIGGPHTYSNHIQKDLKNYNFLNISCRSFIIWQTPPPTIPAPHNATFTVLTVDAILFKT